jgi:hypothetical protein
MTAWPNMPSVMPKEAHGTGLAHRPRQSAAFASREHRQRLAQRSSAAPPKQTAFMAFGLRRLAALPLTRQPTAPPPRRDRMQCESDRIDYGPCLAQRGAALHKGPPIASAWRVRGWRSL